MNSQEIMHKALSGTPINAKEALETYADERNWIGDYTDKREPKKRWVWIGPTLPPWELAQWALNDLKGAQAENESNRKLVVLKGGVV